MTFKRENKYDADTYEISIPSDPSEPDGAAVRIGVFDKVLVEISVEKVWVNLVLFFINRTDFFSFFLCCRIEILNEGKSRWHLLNLLILEDCKYDLRVQLSCSISASIAGYRLDKWNP